MQIIPVIDIKGGGAVLASQGDRENYQPLSTPLCASSDVIDVINAYLSIFPFSQIYIADLDALMGTGNNHKLINSLFSHFQQLRFMIDDGSTAPSYTPLHAKQFIPIIGTESVNTSTLSELRQKTTEFILSLDFSLDHQLMGESILYKSPTFWPKELIIMTLGLVGKNKGPDLAKLQHYYQTYPEHEFIAAGGICSLADLIQLKEIGIQQALVASALHFKKLTSVDIQSVIR